MSYADRECMAEETASIKGQVWTALNKGVFIRIYIQPWKIVYQMQDEHKAPLVRLGDNIVGQI